MLNVYDVTTISSMTNQRIQERYNIPRYNLSESTQGCQSLATGTTSNPLHLCFSMRSTNWAPARVPASCSSPHDDDAMSHGPSPHRPCHRVLQKNNEAAKRIRVSLASRSFLALSNSSAKTTSETKECQCDWSAYDIL